MKIIFFGSEDFAATSLERLIAESHDIAAVVTPPDRARDRMKITFLPVKAMALEHEISLLQPEDLLDKEFQQQLAAFDADLFVVIAYGKILPKIILDMPKVFCINVHASLLPQYRGAAPINWAIINGDQRTGVTIIKMNEGMDAGDMIAQSAIDIPEDIDAQALRERLADLGAVCLLKVIQSLKRKDFQIIPQDEKAVTFAKKLTGELEIIDWGKSAWDIHNLVRGLASKPAAHTLFQGKRLKILESVVFSEKSFSAVPGAVLKLVPQGIVVDCGQGQLLIKRVHLEASRAMDARSFSVGQHVRVGDVFQGEK